MNDEYIKRETKALTLLNEMFGTTVMPRRHRVFTSEATPFPTLTELWEVAGRLPSTARTAGGRPVYRLTRPDVRKLPNTTDNAPRWVKDLGRGDL